MADEDDLFATDDGSADDRDDRPDTDSAVDPRQNEKKKRRHQKVLDEAAGFWKDVFSTHAGRREMYAILKAGGYGEQAFACGPNGFPQPEATWFKLGETSFVDRLFKTWQRQNYKGVYMMLCENDPNYKDARFPAEESDI